MHHCPLHWAHWHCMYQGAGVLLKRHMLHSQVSAVSTESLWQNFLGVAAAKSFLNV